MRTAQPLPNLCQFAGPLPGKGETVDCSACGRTCSARDALQCQVKGPTVEQSLPVAEATIRNSRTVAKPCCDKSPAEPQPAKLQRPGLVKQVGAYGKAIVKWVKDSGGTRSKSEQEINLAICPACPLLGEDGKCDGCGCVIAEKVKMRLESCPAGKWFEDQRPASPLVNPVRNLLHFCLPVAGSKMWRWNLDQLARRRKLFNGKRVLAIAVESSADDVIHPLRKQIKGRHLVTEPPEEVSQYCEEIGLVFDSLEVFENNPKIGEAVAFEWLLSQVESRDPNEITFYCHSKGVTRPDGADNTERWAARMYRACLDDPRVVEHALARFHTAGAFRSNVAMGRARWHYSGTFYWLRNSELFARKWRSVDQQYYGTEAYPGSMFKLEESACLSHDNAGLPYVDSTWVGTLNRESEVWEAARVEKSLSATIIVTCGPNYDRWVRDAVRSALEQEGRPEIVVVFDRCEPIPLPERVQSLTVDHGSVQLARRAGMAVTTGEVLFFLDADNAYHGTRFVRDSVQQLKSATKVDPRIAGVSVNIDFFDHTWNKHSRSPVITPAWDRGRFERINFLDTCTPVWRYALESSWVQTVANGSHEDHHMWRQLARDGWVFAKGQGLTLKYRICPNSSSVAKHQGGYSDRYDYHHQPITIFVPLSGRAWAWPAMRDWFAKLSAAERGKSVRLVLCDTSGCDSFGDMVRRDATALAFVDMRYYRMEVRQPGLADRDRLANEREVQLVCSRIYNRFAQECTTHLALILEDDILPHLSGEDTLRTLIDGLSDKIAAVGGVYHDRRHGKINSWKSSTGITVQHVTQEEMESAPTDYLPISGTGFGCLLIRKEVLQSVPHALPPGEKWYDPRFFNAVNKTGLGVVLARNVTCDHRERTQVGGEPVYSLDWFSQHIPVWEKHLTHFNGTPCQILEVGSYEGRSALWMADHLLSNSESRLTLIDAGIGVGHAGTLDRLRSNLDTSPRRDQISLRVGLSTAILPTLSGPYDLVYIDGSHLGGDTIRDLCNAWPLLSERGILVIDDYHFHEPGVPDHQWAGPAVDYFRSLFRDQIRPLHAGDQMIFQKISVR